MDEKHINVKKRAWLSCDDLVCAKVAFHYNIYEWEDKPDEWSFIEINTGYAQVNLSVEEFDKLAALVAKTQAVYEEKKNGTK
jgi:hypothetical protein